MEITLPLRLGLSSNQTLHTTHEELQDVKTGELEGHSRSQTEFTHCNIGRSIVSLLTTI